MIVHIVDTLVLEVKVEVVINYIFFMFITYCLNKYYTFVKYNLYRIQ